jgi:hypothetical protein
VPTIKKRNELPTLAQITLDLVERFGFGGWEFDYEYPIPDLARQIQIRAEGNYAPKAKVAELAEQMKRNEKFAPIIVTADGYIVDGHTRVAAAVRAGLPFVRALILDYAWEGASEDVQRRVHLLGAAANARHGKGIDREGVRSAVERIAQDSDYDQTRIAALLGVTAGTVKAIVQEMKGRTRAKGLDVEMNGSIPASSMAKLGLAAEKLHDEPFRALAILARDAGLSGKEIDELAKRAREAASDDEAVALIERARLERKGQIEQFVASGKRRPAPSSLLRQRLGYVIGFEARPLELVEQNPDLSEEHESKIRQAMAVLAAVLEAQES